MNDDDTPRARLIQTFELYEFGVDMMAAGLRRRHPDADDVQIEALLDAWLGQRPGAERGDADGVPVPRARFK